MENKILGVLYGMAMGDAMGMPPELWSRKRFLEKYKKIVDFMDGDPENEISYQYHRGNFTDDTSQAITILDSLIETDFKPDASNIASHILAWAKRENAFENNILGPTSKITLELFEKGEDASRYSNEALSNGAAMRIPPIGTLFCADQKKELCDYVYQISHITHSSDITLAGACMVAMAVASALEKEDRDQMIEDVLSVEEYAMSLGASTVSAYGNELNRMMKYLDRDDISKADRERKDAIIAIVDELKKKKKHVDNTDLMVQINGILGDYIMIERAANDRGFAKRFDISKIDFDLLRREFAKVKKKNLAFMDLDELIQVRLDAMIRENPRRVDYYIRYQQIIEEYNSEQDRVNIEKTFMELMDLANSMNEEEQRYVREGFGSDEELSMYDMLFDENLSKEDIKKIKKVAVDLLDKIKTKISELDHWTDKQETKAEVDNLIGKILWEELPESYSDSAIFEYRKLIFEYVFMRYKQVA